MPAEKTVKDSSKKLDPKTVKDNRHKAFLETLKKANKTLSKENDATIGILKDMHVDVERFSSGSFVLDTITDGGFPRGRIIELYGPESSGRTSIALNAIANVQREGGNCVFDDAENAFDPHYATTLGVDVSTLGFSQLSIAEDIITMCLGLVRSNTVDLIVIDSTAALVSRAEDEGGMDKQQMGSIARAMSKGLRLLAPECEKYKCTIIFLNQIREKIGVMFGSPETTPGGRALKFFASQRIDVRRKEVVKDGTKPIGTKVKLKIVKNKVGAPFGEGFTVLTFAHGIDRIAELLVVGIEDKVLYQKSPQSSIYYNPINPDSPELQGIEIEPEKINGKNMYKLGGHKSDAMKTSKYSPVLYKNITKDIQFAIDAQRNGTFDDSENEDDDMDEDSNDTENDNGGFDFDAEE